MLAFTAPYPLTPRRRERASWQCSARPRVATAAVSLALALAAVSAEVPRQRRARAAAAVAVAAVSISARKRGSAVRVREELGSGDGGGGGRGDVSSDGDDVVVHAIEGRAVDGDSGVFAASRGEWGEEISWEDEPEPKTAKSSTYSYSYARSKKAASPPAEERLFSDDMLRSFRSEFEEPDTAVGKSDDSDSDAGATAPGVTDISLEARRRAREMASRRAPAAPRPPTPMTATSAVRLMLRLPAKFLAEFLLPSVHILSLLWYDVKTRLLETPAGADAYFDITQMNSVGREERERMWKDGDGTAWEEAPGLSEEERQVEAVQKATEKAVKQVGSTVRDIFGRFL